MFMALQILTEDGRVQEGLHSTNVQMCLAPQQNSHTQSASNRQESHSTASPFYHGIPTALHSST